MPLVFYSLFPWWLFSKYKCSALHAPHGLKTGKYCSACAYFFLLILLVLLLLRLLLMLLLLLLALDLLLSLTMVVVL